MSSRLSVEVESISVEKCEDGDLREIEVHCSTSTLRLLVCKENCKGCRTRRRLFYGMQLTGWQQ